MLVDVSWVQPVVGAQPQIVGQEREVMLVAGAEHDGVDLAGAAVLEMRGGAVDVSEQRHLGERLGPVVSHRPGTVAESDFLRAVLVTLRSDVLGRVAAADEKQSLAGEFGGVAEIVGVQDASGETVEALELRHVRSGEVPGGDDDVVEFVGFEFALVVIHHGDGELFGLLGVFDPPDGRVEPDVLAHVTLLDPTHDVVEEDCARWVRGDGAPEVFLEGVVGELEAFLGAVGPQVPVHARVNGLAVCIEPVRHV